MYSIWKFILEVTDEQEIEMPRDAELLCVQEQNGEICVWAKVKPNNPTETRTFFIHGTGHTWHHDFTYFGTVQIGRYVWHVFTTIK